MKGNSDNSDDVTRMLDVIAIELSGLTQRVAQMEAKLVQLTVAKDWYSTSDIARLMGVTSHTVRERWCNQARIECEKDPESGQWRIPAVEFERLKRGGKPLSNRSIPL